jgi:hypothetical protein
MSANKNVRVCVATSPGLLIEVDADRDARKAPCLPDRTARTSYASDDPAAET